MLPGGVTGRGRGVGLRSRGRVGRQRKEEKRKEDQQGASELTHTLHTHKRTSWPRLTAKPNEQKSTPWSKGKWETHSHSLRAEASGAGFPLPPPCTASCLGFAGGGGGQQSLPSPPSGPAARMFPLAPGGLAPICGGTWTLDACSWGWLRAATSTPPWLCMNLRLDPSRVTCSKPPSPVFMSCTGNSPSPGPRRGTGVSANERAFWATGTLRKANGLRAAPPHPA